MASLAEINAVIADQAAKAATASNLSASTASDVAAADKLAADTAVLSADLLANGDTVTVDTTQTPPVVVLYHATSPTTFTATPEIVAV